MASKYSFETSRERSELMSKIRSSNTKAEVKLRRALYLRGLRFRVHNKNLFGNPDISIKKYKLVVFVDGEFWHGFNWTEKKLKLSSNRQYWIPKIERNMSRDIIVNQFYKEKGWLVFRYWEKQINKNIESCVDEIFLALSLKNQLKLSEHET